MKINFPALFNTPLEKHRFFFIFGNEASVFERAISFLSLRLKAPLKYAEESNVEEFAHGQTSLFDAPSDTPIVLVPNVTDKLLKKIDLLKEGTFIFTSQKARAKSNLVEHFTSAPASLAIAAYASPLIPAEFDFLAQGLNLNPKFKALLQKTYQNDTLGLVSTLQKIRLYGDVPEEHFEAFLNPSHDTEDMKPLLQSLLLKNAAQTATNLHLLTMQNLIPFLRSLSRSLQVMIELKSQPRPYNWMRLSTPVFFKDQPLYEGALPKWTPERLRETLEALLTLEKKIKFEAPPLSVIASHLLNL